MTKLNEKLENAKNVFSFFKITSGYRKRIMIRKKGKKEMIAAVPGRNLKQGYYRPISSYFIDNFFFFHLFELKSQVLHTFLSSNSSGIPLFFFQDSKIDEFSFMPKSQICDNTLLF